MPTTPSAVRAHTRNRVPGRSVRRATENPPQPSSPGARRHWPAPSSSSPATSCSPSIRWTAARSRTARPATYRVGPRGSPPPSAPRPSAPAGRRSRPADLATAPALLERRDERARLVRLLGRGRSVRLTGPAGSGRSALLDAVAADCAELAPDGVVRLCGHRRSPSELLHELYATVFRTSLHRPDRTTLHERVRRDRRHRRPRRPRIRRGHPRRAPQGHPRVRLPPRHHPRRTGAALRIARRRGLPVRPRPQRLARTPGAGGRPAADRRGGQLGGRPLVRVRGPAAALRPGRGAPAPARPAARRAQLP